MRISIRAYAWELRRREVQRRARTTKSLAHATRDFISNDAARRARRPFSHGRAARDRGGRERGSSEKGEGEQNSKVTGGQPAEPALPPLHHPPSPNAATDAVAECIPSLSSRLINKARKSRGGCIRSAAAAPGLAKCASGSGDAFLAVLWVGDGRAATRMEFLKQSGSPSLLGPVNQGA